MRKLILSILLIIPVFVHPQKIDSLLLPYVNEYVSHAKEYGLDVNTKIEKLDFIRIKKLKSDHLGYYDGRGIGIAQLDSSKTKLLRAVFYHEMGHVFGLPHVCASECPFLMATAIYTDIYSDMDEKTWRDYTHTYFHSIINNNKLIQTKVIINGKNNRKNPRRETTTYFGFK